MSPQVCTTRTHEARRVRTCDTSFELDGVRNICPNAHDWCAECVRASIDVAVNNVTDTAAMPPRCCGVPIRSFDSFLLLHERPSLLQSGSGGPSPLSNSWSPTSSKWRSAHTKRTSFALAAIVWLKKGRAATISCK